MKVMSHYINIQSFNLLSRKCRVWGICFLISTLLAPPRILYAQDPHLNSTAWPTAESNVNPKPASKDQTLLLTIGEQIRLKVRPQSRIYIQKRIVQAQTQGSQLILTATHKGQTRVKVDDESFSIFVLTSEDAKALEALKSNIANHPGLELHFTEEQLVLDGEALSISDFENLFKWSEQYTLSWPLKLRFVCPEYILAEASALFSQKLKQAVSLPKGRLHALHLKTKPTAEALELLKRFNLQYVFDEVAFAPMGRLRIYFAEVKKSHLEQISPLLNSTHPLKPLSLEDILTSEYRHNDENLFSRVGSQTEILLFDQQPAKIHSGGEFPILNQSFHSSDVSWKQFGLFLDVLGKDLDDRSSILDLNFKLSMVVNSNNENGIPSLTSDSWVQKIRVSKNQTYILKSGFTKHHLQGQQGSSIFKHIPLLKFLFQGRSKNTGDSDLVLVLTLSDGV